ncbi:YdeI/OmpD-associated family protein [Joostella sp.]|uniref:YdeI/OmpD-associated family protein n=1 Tax=Joostella sp. TaxID=2231138 RepID=UPI003A946784
MTTNNADAYFNNSSSWKEELLSLRSILLETELEETIKWGVPTYTIANKNVVGIAAFKSYVGLWFHNGALLKDDARVLINAQEGKTVALRQWRFISIKDIDDSKKLIKKYTEEAITNQKLGKEVLLPKKKTIVSKVFEIALKEDNKLNEAFNTLTKGKQKEYHEYISEAKRDTTKLSRLEKATPLILTGKGLYDKYKK